MSIVVVTAAFESEHFITNIQCRSNTVHDDLKEFRNEVRSAYPANHDGLSQPLHKGQ